MGKERFNIDESTSAEPPFDKYLGSYVSISTPAGSSESGKLIGFTNGYALLNPFMGSDYTSKKGLVTKLVEDTMLVNMHPHFSITPTTKKNMEKYCTSKNRDYQREKKLREKQLEDNGIDQDNKE